MKSQPMIAVHNVEASSRWYQQVLGFQSGHGGQEYEQLLSEGEMVLQLHLWEAHEHPHMGNPQSLPYGNGVMLWFETKFFHEIVCRIQTAKAQILDGPLFNPNAQHQEIWVRDLDGYVVVIASPYNNGANLVN